MLNLYHDPEEGCIIPLTYIVCHWQVPEIVCTSSLGRYVAKKFSYLSS